MPTNQRCGAVRVFGSRARVVLLMHASIHVLRPKVAEEPPPLQLRGVDDADLGLWLCTAAVAVAHIVVREGHNGLVKCGERFADDGLERCFGRELLQILMFPTGSRTA